mmetsp:Transcript_8695/g.38387  ORF Transcript_8695/g.38387 Transcript_8695/m.38387 type:complete len:435 (+) Transcript_8695:115-1419(+)
MERHRPERSTGPFDRSQTPEPVANRRRHLLAQLCIFVVQRGKAELPFKRSVLALERRHEHQHVHASIPHERIARRLHHSGVSHRVQRNPERRDADANVVAQRPLLVVPAQQVARRQPALIETLPLQRLVQRRHRFNILVPREGGEPVAPHVVLHPRSLVVHVEVLRVHEDGGGDHLREGSRPQSSRVTRVPVAEHAVYPDLRLLARLLRDERGARSHRTDHDVALQRVELLVDVVIDDPRGFAQQLAVLGGGHVVVDEDDVAQAPARVERHRVEIVGEDDGVHVHADVVQEPRGVASQRQVFARTRHVRHRESQLALRLLLVVPPVEIAGDRVGGIPVHPLVVDARTSRHVQCVRDGTDDGVEVRRLVAHHERDGLTVRVQRDGPRVPEEQVEGVEVDRSFGLGVGRVRGRDAERGFDGRHGSTSTNAMVRDAL